MRSWLEFEKRFREIAVSLHSLRLDFHWGAAGESWHLGGMGRDLKVRQFEGLAALAGQLLGQCFDNSTNAGRLILSKTNPTERWYQALKELSSESGNILIAIQTNEDGSDAGYIYSDFIGNICEVSANLCLHLHASFPLDDLNKGAYSIAIPSDTKQVRMTSWAKRLQVHQEAYTLWRKLLTTLHDEDKTFDAVRECQDWWDKNCLYLLPDASFAFRRAYQSASFRHDFLRQDNLQMREENWSKIEDAGAIITSAVASINLDKSATDNLSEDEVIPNNINANFRDGATNANVGNNNQINNTTNIFHSETNTSPKPKLSLKFIDGHDTYKDEIEFRQEGQLFEWRFHFGLVLHNDEPASKPAEKISIRIEFFWRGDIIQIAPQFYGDIHNRTTPRWSVLSQEIAIELPAVLIFRGTEEDRCPYNFPLAWHRFTLSLQEKVQGYFLLQYHTISAETETRGELRINMK